MKVADASDQPKSRRVITVPDQHGRLWEVTIDKESFVHCTIPIPRFRAPMLPPPEFVTSNPERPGRVRIDYRAWAEARLSANREWEARELQLRRVEPDAVARAQVLGIRPEAPEFVEAARLGESRWILGIRKPDGTEYPVPSWAKDLGLDRLTPRPTAPRDLKAERRALRGRYRDEEEGAAAPVPPVDDADLADDPDAEDGPGDADAAWRARFPDADGADDDPDDLSDDDFEDDVVETPDDDLEDQEDEPDETAPPAALTPPTSGTPATPARRPHRRTRAAGG